MPSPNRVIQSWGIKDLEGERRYIRHVKFTGPKGEDIEAVLVYDYRECTHTSTTWSSSNHFAPSVGPNDA